MIATRQSARTVFILIAIATIALIGSQFLMQNTPHFASADASQNVSGWAWSSNFGWISFNCTDIADCDPNYGVNLDASNNLVGYAWSPNVGWIQFGNLLSGFPTVAEAPGTVADDAKLDGTQLVGWARALSGGTAQAGGWNGWISLSGTGYGVTLNGNDFEGFAWDADANAGAPNGIGIGWISFNCTDIADCDPNYGVSVVLPGASTVTVTASPNPVTSGSTTELDWINTNVSSCEPLSGPWPNMGAVWSGTEATGGPGVFTNSITVATTFELECSGPSGPVTGSVTVNVAAPLAACENGLDDDSDGLHDHDGAGVSAPDPGCSGPSDPDESDGPPTTELDPTITSFLTEPSRVPRGGQCKLIWNVTNTDTHTTCDLTGPFGFTPIQICATCAHGFIGELLTPPHNQSGNYVLTCRNDFGTGQVVMRTATCAVQSFQEF